MNTPRPFKCTSLLIVSLAATMFNSSVIAKPNQEQTSACSNQDDQCSTELVKRACAKTIEAYAFVRDHLKFKEYGQLFTEDGSFQIANQNKVEGRQAIVDALRIRGPLAITRHFNQIVKMEVIDPKTITAISYVSVYSGDPKEAQNDAQALTPWVIGEYHDTLKMVNRECLIKDRKVEIIFQQTK